MSANYLGDFNTGQNLSSTVAWTPEVGDTVTASELTLTHEVEGDIVVAEGDETAANTFRAPFTLNKAGRWELRWTTTPPGGVAEASIYIEP